MAASTSVTLQAVNPTGASVTAGLAGDAEASRQGAASSGSGGWQIVDRPRRRATTEWLDYSPLQMQLSLIIDGGDGLAPASIETEIATLESWEVPVSGGIEPPQLSISGPVPHTDTVWVLYGLKLKEAIRDPATGLRTQQNVDISLLEYAPPSVQISESTSPATTAQQRQTAGASSASAAAAAGPAAFSASASSSASGSSSGASGSGSGSASAANGVLASGQTYNVRPGDTLSSIAARVLGNVNLWTQIATLNNIRDPRSIQPGQVLKLPAVAPAGSRQGLSATSRPV